MATVSARHEQRSIRPILLNVWRVFLALWYLGGSLIHFLCALYRPQIYVRFGATPIFPQMGRFWAAFVMPHITNFALLLAAFELAVVV
jgi:hypothetical protein